MGNTRYLAPPIRAVPQSPGRSIDAESLAFTVGDPIMDLLAAYQGLGKG